MEFNIAYQSLTTNHKSGFRWWARQIFTARLSLILILGVSILLAGTLAEVRAANITSFGNLLLIVISNGLWKPLSEMSGVSGDENQQAWQAMKSELTKLSSSSKQIITEMS